MYLLLHLQCIIAVQIMCALSNARVNGILEYEIPEHVKKPNPSTSRLAKYSTCTCALT